MQQENLQQPTQSVEIQRPWAKELDRLSTVLGPTHEQLSGDIVRNDRGTFDFVPGQLNEDLLRQKMGQSLSDGITTFGEYEEHEQKNAMLRSLQVQAQFKNAATEQDRNKWRRELLLSNQEATRHEYVPEVARQVGEVFKRYEHLRELGHQLHLPLPADYDRFESDANIFLKSLNNAMEARTRFADARDWQTQVNLKKQLPALRQQYDALKAKPRRTPAEENTLTEVEAKVKLADAIGFGQATVESLEQRYQQSLDALAPEDKATMLSGNGRAIEVRAGNMNQKILDILAGKKEAAGTSDDFLPHVAYINLWKRYDADLLAIQQELERKAVNDAPAANTDEKKYLDNVRAEMTVEMTSFINDVGQYQLALNEIAGVQNQIGHDVDFTGVSPALPILAPADADKFDIWLDERAEYRANNLRGAMGNAREMLKAGSAEQIEDMWTKQGEVIVLDVSARLAKVASAPFPSETNGSGVLEKVYKTAAPFVGLPGSKEESIKNLQGPLAEAMGVPPGKTWAELSEPEKAEILKRTKSVLDALQNFDENTITNFEQSNDLAEQMRKKYSPEFAGQDVDEEILNALDEGRITSDMTGQQVNGKVINAATAYTLVLRQRRKDWGDPEAKTGFIGQYRQLLESFDENIKHHLDMGGALLRMQQAWIDYSKDALKFAALVGVTPWVMAALWGLAGSVAYPLLRRGVPLMWRTGRSTVGRSARLVRGLSQQRETSQATQNALNRMRYIARERQLAQWFQSTRGGQWFSKLPSVRNTRVVRGGGAALKYGTAAIIPAVAAYNVYTTEQQAQRAEGNSDLQSHYREDHITTGLEAGGLGLTLLLSAGPQIALTIPIVYAGSYRRDRAEVKADWIRDIDDWLKEFDSSGLMGKLRDTNVTNAVKAGGGGSLYPRIAYPFVGGSRGQIEAVDTINKGQIGSRGKIMEAYFRRNLLVAEQTPKEDIDTAIRRKVQYMSLVTQGEYNDTFASEFESADIYADLLQMKDAMEKAGEPPLLSYFNEAGEREWLDLKKLQPGIGERTEIQSIVNAYKKFVRPVEEVYMFNMMGQVARDLKNPRERREKYDETAARVRFIVAYKLSHDIYKFDSYIESINWPGVDSPVTSGNTKSANVVRSYIAANINKELDSLVPNLLEGNMENPVEYYTRVLTTCRSFMQDPKAQDGNGTSEEYYQKAEAYFKGNLSAAQNPGKNPLTSIIPEPQEPRK